MGSFATGIQANDFYTQGKTWLGVTGTPDGFLEKTLPEWFGYFQVPVFLASMPVSALTQM